MRLDKFVCKSTELSREEAAQYIRSGAVQVNGEPVLNEASQVHENNDILLEGERLRARAFRYILMHKPAGTVSSNIDEAYPSLFNYLSVDRPSELHVVGRLDADTTGLVLITDDGRWSFGITQPNRGCSKIYRVTLSRSVSETKAEEMAIQFAQGIQLQGEKALTLPADLTVIGEKEALLTLYEGKFHQVKRMFSAVGNRVVSLHREQIGNVRLDVDVGEWRHLSKDEIQSFQ
ncbi:pseudouridine synthase [Marinomonas sp.]|nr:pseudouridine synthase [Marinomonas sp.]MDB4837927.1 pseudouridine synthase [Marinomonas sp.]